MKNLAALLGALCVCGLASVPAFGADHTTLGTPGDPNCVGQSNAALAQLGKNAGVQDARGIGQLVHYETANNNPLTVQELKAAVDAYCAA
jgi:hypothetical protein